MTYDNILYDVTDHVATITINRPESMNAISYKARDELHDACGRVSADPDVWACIITGAGERAFSTGLDLKERAREVDDSTFFDKVAPVDSYMDVAREIARKVCLGAPLSVIAIKEAITKGMQLPLEQGLKLESELGLALSTTEDQKEGSRAFAEKRPAVWKGR